MGKWNWGARTFSGPYPDWVKLAFSICVLSGAAFFVGLVVAAPNSAPPPSQNNSPEPMNSGNSETTAWLTIKGVTGFGYLDGKDVRVTANVAHTYS